MFNVILLELWKFLSWSKMKKDSMSIYKSDKFKNRKTLLLFFFFLQFVVILIITNWYRQNGNSHNQDQLVNEHWGQIIALMSGQFNAYK